ncbi:hypothetical protein COV24_02845 [candidate division WWE3 bacterium CG10_big_fil_rev_8_21_14_0_10_32_10]|uniref:Uncharacterized protein n=1 Tax=candidate division WWE3 bacterium CG10_big_fil_rev_8_21_14_0_10_32_10 TaxID=1975090 RepID=A0A2H0RBQ1_UNCKA|nr:MAG: hypothetical protein COV24_02845 [candidate division WWE3 bacterium CG10_big_fil_rev_8_21_14_0_10_32_10]
MEYKIQEKLNKIQNILVDHKYPSGRVSYIVKAPNTPEHIKFRYYANILSGNAVDSVGLEYVTKIDSDYVGFKDIFKVKMASLKNTHPQIQSHVDLFLELISLNPQKLIFE